MMRSFLIFRKTIILIAFVTAFYTNAGYSQVVITQTQALDFGTFAFGSFNSALSVTIRDNGSFNANGNASVIVAPTRGEFSLTGGPANSIYTVTTPASFTLSGPGGNFTIDDIRVRPNILRTDGSGADDFQIAARLTSLGGGAQYGNGDYSDTFDIIIAF